MVKNLLIGTFVACVLFLFSQTKQAVGVQDKTTSLKGIINMEKSTFTIPDDGIEGESTAVFTPITSYTEVTCQDPVGCILIVDDTIGTTGDFIMLTASQSSTRVDLENSSVLSGTTIFSANDIALAVHNGISWVLK